MISGPTGIKKTWTTPAAAKPKPSGPQGTATGSGVASPTTAKWTARDTSAYTPEQVAYNNWRPQGVWDVADGPSKKPGFWDFDMGTPGMVGPPPPPAPVAGLSEPFVRTRGGGLNGAPSIEGTRLGNFEQVPGYTPESPNVTEAKSIADSSNKEAQGYFDEYKTAAKGALDSGVFGKDQAARDALLGKGTEFEGGTAANYYLGREMDGLRDKSYAEKWFTGEGPDSLASVYDREGRKQNIAMQNRLSAMGKGNSGAAIRGGAELDAELSSKKALQLQSAAKDADTGQMNRLGKMKDFSSEIGTQQSYLGQNLSGQTVKDRTAAERGLEVQASIPSQKKATFSSIFDANTEGRDLVQGAKKEDIAMLGDAASKIGATALAGMNSSSQADVASFENMMNMTFRKAGMTTEAAAAKIKQLTAAAGGIGPLMELMKGMNSGDDTGYADTSSYGDGVMDPTG